MAENDTVEAPAGKKGQTPAEYGIDAKTFAFFWENSSDPTEAHQKMAAFCREHGHPVIPRPVMISRASKYRAQGVKLQKFRAGLRTASESVRELNEFIAQNRAQAQTGGAPVVPSAPPRRPAPPAVDEDKVKAEIRAMIANLRKKHGK